MGIKKQPLRDRLSNYLKKRPSEWVSSGMLQRLVAQHTDYTPRTAVRRLEELAEEGELEVEYRKGHAWYRSKQGMSKDDYIAYGRGQVALFDKV